MQERLSTIELQRENMKFSAAHFTIFSATDREPLHGHNYSVNCALTVRVSSNGLNFDYRYYKKVLAELCQQLHQGTLLAAHSPHLRFEEDGEYMNVYFASQRIVFLKHDIKLVPVVNITVEELSNWFVQQLLKDQATLNQHCIEKIKVTVFSGPGQSGASWWESRGPAWPPQISSTS